MPFWPRIILLAVLLFPLPMHATGAPSSRCRCPERTLEQYFADADVVLIGRIISRRRVAAGEEDAAHVEVRVRPHFRAGNAYKGQIADMVFATPLDPASCGVAVAVGEDHVIFATTTLRGNQLVGWFDRCSGSRRYPGPVDARAHLFLGLTARDAVFRLAELADPGPMEPPTTSFHTSPACWAAPRIHHQGALPRDLQAGIAIRRAEGELPDREGVISPNRAYVAWGDEARRGDTSVVVVEIERPWHLRVVVTGVSGSVAPQWLTEKLLFFRVAQGRVQYTDVLLDVETGKPIYLESARDGTLAFDQFRQACLGQCPCRVVPGSADSLPAPPAAVGLPLEQAALTRMVVGGRASLDIDWDGRVFSDAGGVRFTRPQVPTLTPGQAHTIDLEDVRFVADGWWARVAIYLDNPCHNPEAIPVHAGWVPAFSSSGHLVLASGPEVC